MNRRMTVSFPSDLQPVVDELQTEDVGQVQDRIFCAAPSRVCKVECLCTAGQRNTFREGSFGVSAPPPTSTVVPVELPSWTTPSLSQWLLPWNCRKSPPARSWLKSGKPCANVVVTDASSATADQIAFFMFLVSDIPSY